MLNSWILLPGAEILPYTNSNKLTVQLKLTTLFHFVFTKMTSKKYNEG